MLALQTERQHGNETAEHVIQAALDALSAHIAVLDDNGRIVFVNAAWRQFDIHNVFMEAGCGIGTDYLAVCDRAAMRDLPDGSLVARGIRDVIAGARDIFLLEYPCHVSLEKRWFVLRVSRFYVGDELRVVVARQNISELKNAQVHLEESRQEIKSLLDHISNAVFTVKADGSIETCNPAAERIFGYKRDELIGMVITRLLSDTRYHRDNLHELNGERGRELLGKRCDGAEFPMYFDLNRMNGENGILYTVVVQDMTEIKKMEREMREKERIRVALQKEQEMREMKNRFLSMMSHELRTPLASILLSHDMISLYGEQATEDERLQYLDNIRVQVEHLNEVVGDVMSLSKVERGEQEFSPYRGDLITFCRNIVESFQINHHHTHNIAFDCSYQELIADFDYKFMRRALTNLIDNAIKYSPDGGTVAISVQQDSRCVRITVSDEGIGIPADEATNLFEAFQRASNVGSLPGTGLGLAIAKQAVERHGGRIRLLPRRGVGTTFMVEFPLHATGELITSMVL